MADIKLFLQGYSGQEDDQDDDVDGRDSYFLFCILVEFSCYCCLSGIFLLVGENYERLCI